MRNYDPQIGRFNCIDVLAEHYFSLTPYQFAGNNPVSFNDPSGAKFTKNEPTVNPAQFSNVKELLDYISNHGIDNFEDNFNRWVFGADNQTVEFGSGNEFSINSNGSVTFSWFGEKYNGTPSTWQNATGSSEGSESKSLNELVMGRTTLQIKEYWGYAMSWGETYSDASYSWYGGEQHYDVMWSHNYELYKSRMQRGVSAQSSGDRASYDRQLPGLKAQYRREQSAIHTERMMYAGFGAAVAAPFAVYGALESGAVGAAMGVYRYTSSALAEAGIETGILVNSAKNYLVSALVNEVSLYTSSSIVTALGTAGYQHTVTGGNLVNALYFTGSLFSNWPAGGKYLIPILPH